MPASRDIVPGVHRMVNSFANWYLVEDGGRVTAVDAGLPGFKSSLPADLDALGLSLDDIDALILTHSDADHTGLAGVIQAAGAPVLIHATDEPTLRKPGPKSGDAKPINMVRDLWRPSLWKVATEMVRHGGARPRPVEGATTFEDGVLDVPGKPRVILTPGHTPGHCAFYFEQHGALIVGDAMCTWSPLTGRVGPQLMPRSFNVSNANALSSLDAIEPLEADVLLPGHGEPWRDGVAAAVTEARAG
jgi:glyoxylase-like metal-dependent hydrolase (beta-lactamase superfamily II)